MNTKVGLRMKKYSFYICIQIHLAFATQFCDFYVFHGSVFMFDPLMNFSSKKKLNDNVCTCSVIVAGALFNEYTSNFLMVPPQLAQAKSNLSADLRISGKKSTISRNLEINN